MKNIEFSIGPSNKDVHDFVVTWLYENSFNIKDISFNGDHYSEIYVLGNYNKAYKKLGDLDISFETWEVENNEKLI